MKKLIILGIFLVGCNTNPPKPFIAGEEVSAPAGCIELRKKDAKADC